MRCIAIILKLFLTAVFRADNLLAVVIPSLFAYSVSELTAVALGALYDTRQRQLPIA